MAVRHPRIDPTIDRSQCPAEKHGTRFYRRKYHCTCPDAAVAERRYEKLHKAGLLPPAYVPVTGTARRLRALAVAGYGLRRVAGECDATLAQLSEWRSERLSRVHRTNAAMIAEVYERLKDQPGRSGRAREWALSQGWHGPEAWAFGDIDDPDEEPAVFGRSERVGRGKKVAELREIGCTTDEIARILGVEPAEVREAERRTRKTEAA